MYRDISFKLGFSLNGLHISIKNKKDYLFNFFFFPSRLLNFFNCFNETFIRKFQNSLLYNFFPVCFINNPIKDLIKAFKELYAIIYAFVDPIIEFFLENYYIFTMKSYLLFLIFIYFFLLKKGGFNRFFLFTPFSIIGCYTIVESFSYKLNAMQNLMAYEIDSLNSYIAIIQLLILFVFGIALCFRFWCLRLYIYFTFFKLFSDLYFKHVEDSRDLAEFEMIKSKYFGIFHEYLEVWFNSNMHFKKSLSFQAEQIFFPIIITIFKYFNISEFNTGYKDILLKVDYILIIFYFFLSLVFFFIFLFILNNFIFVLFF